MFFNKLTDLCHDLIFQDKKLLHYLEDRKITKKSIERYKIGSFPKDLRLLLNNIHSDDLLDRGIIWNAYESPFKYSSKGCNIHFPIVFPIHNLSGNTVAIGCRTLLPEDKRKDLGVPKYRNSVYKKTAFLYGLNDAAEEIQKQNKVFVVEGYFDVISCHQNGIKNVVGTLGTLFSKRQLIILSRYTNNIVLLFDNDQPGRTSAKKVLDKFNSCDTMGIDISYRFTPDGFKDIDEYLRSGKDFDF